MDLISNLGRRIKLSKPTGTTMTLSTAKINSKKINPCNKNLCFIRLEQGFDCKVHNLGKTASMSRGRYFTIDSYGGVRRKDLCYDPIPEILSDIDTQSQNFCQILIPDPRILKK